MTVGIVRKGRDENHGVCPRCGADLPRHEASCRWGIENPLRPCTNSAHDDFCPLLAEKMSSELVSRKVIDFRLMEKFRWRYLHDEYTFLLFPREPTIGQRMDRCTPCGHPQGEIVAKRQVGCILVRCTSCGWEGVYHLPGCGRICASATPFSASS